MKRKFSFGLPPLKIPSRAETRALKEALAGHVDFESTPITPPLSPFIYRRPLDSRTERELRSACAEIVASSDGEPEQKLNFQPLHATKAIDKTAAVPVPKPVRTQSTVKAPIRPPSQIPNRQSSKSDIRHNEVPVQPPNAQEEPQTTSRRQHEPSYSNFSPREGHSFPPRKDSISVRANKAINPLLMSPPDRPWTAPFDNASDISSATPKTASTDRHFNYASTAITSAELTPPHRSSRASQLVLDNEAYRAAQHQADAEAAMWMRQEFEKRRQQAQTTAAPQPPPSRSSARAWISDVREFVRPGSSSGSRPATGNRPGSSNSQTRDSLSHSREASGSIRSSSAQGWRSWGGLRRKSSKSSFTEVTEGENGKPGSEQYDGRKEVNLNKGLPSLPSLDTWKEPAPKANSGQHIAMLMKASKSKSKRPKSSTVSQTSTAMPMKIHEEMPIVESASSTSKSMPQLQGLVQLPGAERSPSSPLIRTVPIAKSQVRRISAAPDARKSHVARAHHSTSSTDSCFSPGSSVGVKRSVDLNRTAERFAKQESNVDLNKVSERLEKHERMQKMKSYTKSTTSLTHQRHLSDCSNQTRPTTQDGRTPNFSRKISIDNYGRVYDPILQNKVEITALPMMPPKKQNSRLRRVLSKLEINNKTNRQPKTWMDTFEADGIKTGVIEARGSTDAPIIKY